MAKARVIAFYLPQFHPIPENDEWWGKGFTEWTNVGKAKPLFPGHKQPKVPSDLGYYDLRLPEIYDEQTRLAKEAGIEGFCFWHYYFGDGKQLLEKPLQRIVNESKNDFPFCLGWANESWYAKVWSNDKTKDKLLLEQKYNGIEDYEKHFYLMLNTFLDKRYIKVDGKLLFLIYRPDEFKDVKVFMDLWQELAKKEGLNGFHFVASSKRNIPNPERYLALGYDAVYTDRMWKGFELRKSIIKSTLYLICKLFRYPRIESYKAVVNAGYSEDDKNEYFYPGILCGWDHTPRSKKNGMCVIGFSQKLFGQHIRKILTLVKDKLPEHKVIFLKSWNEWGEGNYMEPDFEYGNMKLETLKAELID